MEVDNVLSNPLRTSSHARSASSTSSACQACHAALPQNKTPHNYPSPPPYNCGRLSSSNTKRICFAKQPLPPASLGGFVFRAPQGGLLASPPSSIRRACIIDPGQFNWPPHPLRGCTSSGSSISGVSYWPRTHCVVPGPVSGGQGALGRYVIGAGTHLFTIELLNHITVMPGGPSLVARVLDL